MLFGTSENSIFFTTRVSFKVTVRVTLFPFVDRGPSVTEDGSSAAKAAALIPVGQVPLHETVASEDTDTFVSLPSTMLILSDSIFRFELK